MYFDEKEKYFLRFSTIFSSQTVYYTHDANKGQIKNFMSYYN